MKELKASTNVILLEKNKEYIMVFDQATGAVAKDIADLSAILEARGIRMIGILLENSKGLKVVEKDNGKNTPKA